MSYSYFCAILKVWVFSRPLYTYNASTSKFFAIMKQNVKLNNCFETVKSQVFFVSPPAKYFTVGLYVI